ncbi:MAG: hypothetical protein ACXVA2_07195 [Mucilaginibacter sp.]
MERTEPVNPERKVNLLVKILLYPQVTTFKVLIAIPGASRWRQNYHSRSVGWVIIVFTELIIFNYFFPDSDKIFFNRFLFGILVYHLALEVIFNKEICVMGFDYYSYYNKALLYVFLVFLAIGLTGFCISVYNEVGHVPKY